MTLAEHFNLCQSGAVYRECSFNADAVRNTTYGEHFFNTAATAGNYYTFISLYTFTSSFDYTYGKFYGIARTEFRNILTELFLFQSFNNVHFILLNPRRSCARHSGPSVLRKKYFITTRPNLQGFSLPNLTFAPALLRNLRYFPLPLFLRQDLQSLSW